MNEYFMKEEQLTHKNNFRLLLGTTIEKVEKGFAVLSLPENENLLQTSKMVHGGVLATLVDSVIGTAVRTVLPENKRAVTAELNLNFLRPAMRGKIIGEGRIINNGKNLIVGEASIKDANGKLIAVGRATFYVSEKSF
jgi:uncharacterized protein (TIGR00369 family)